MVESVCISITVRLWLLYSIADEDLLISPSRRADCFISHTHIQAPHTLDATQDSLNSCSYAHDRHHTRWMLPKIASIPVATHMTGSHAQPYQLACTLLSLFFLITF